MLAIYLATPIHIHRREDILEDKGNDAEENPERQKAFGLSKCPSMH